ncbi:carbohydrate ABC transporter permease [Tuanshanicoccus lijuaniae]|uniref:carbohydrate ABC transporter permease n=1 Tax=Aerococcaceae bacterium zg-1292 TaxID=2774330 RepID=UPI001935A3F4|nr:carbohydrate ABC transporter permease [Aerococcaceae bacterium zg-1292]QQA36861.1 carbohydrate ABC transporter permease [Aerococcaceae bacterium zg-1292]
MKNKKIINILIVLILSIGAIIMVGPLLWMISTSLKNREGVFQLPPQWIPKPIILDAYKRLLELDTLFSGIKNTVIVSLSVTIVGTLTSSLAAFSFAKLKLPFKNIIFLVLLSAIMVPYPAVMIPQFMMFSKIGWIDTLLPLIVPGLFGNITMIFFLRQYLSNIPDSVVEAAKIDGANYITIFSRLIFPLIKPAVAAQFILWFMGVWNDYLAPLIYLNTPSKQTLQVVIANLNAAYAIQTDYPLIMAASVVSLIPVLAVFIIFQKQIIESIAISGTKG